MKLLAPYENSVELAAATGRNLPVNRDRRVLTGLWKAARASASRCEAGIETSRESRSARSRVTWLSITSLASSAAATSPTANAMQPFANFSGKGLAARTAAPIQSAWPVQTQSAEYSMAFESASSPLNPRLETRFARQFSSRGVMSIPLQKRTDARMRKTESAVSGGKANGGSLSVTDI